MDESIKVIHYGNSYTHKGTYLLIKFDCGTRACILWEGKNDPPKQAWWNKYGPEFVRIKGLLKGNLGDI